MPPTNRQPQATPAQNKNPAPSAAAPVLTATPAPINKKKAKRRAKEAAKRATGHVAAARPESPLSNSLHNGADLHVPGAFEQSTLDPQEYDHDEQGYEETSDDQGLRHDELGYSDAELPSVPKSKSKKKRKNKKGSLSDPSQSYYASDHTGQPLVDHLHPPPPPPLDAKNGYRVNKDRIWNSTAQEERENIKEFWLSLEETERRSLVKVEKEAVLKKMKEQQKHSCSCSVCGRKRTAIEEELEVLYDAYYEELEQYANHQVVLEDGTPLTGPETSRLYPPMHRLTPPGSHLPPIIRENGPHSRFQEEDEAPDEEDDDELGPDEGFSDEEDDGYDDYDDDEAPPHAMDFFNFGNSLTVKGGILTVADDLLKNDGKKFIEMMEQLAERRMQREEEAQYAAAGLRHPNNAHYQGAPTEEDLDYEDDEYATEDDEYEDEDDEEPVCTGNGDCFDQEDGQLICEQEGLSEEQRMEEGRRMFQIFAARMFEQRVLTAYREKVARERQEKLLEELNDEKDRDAEKEAKKARDAAKKKEKKKAQKQAKEEEKAKKEAEKQAAEAAAKAEEERKAEEIRTKREEQKKKRDEEKRRQEEDKQKKDEEKKRKQLEARKQQEEVERKQREQREKERQKREEAKKLREREEREVKEREAKERHERESAEKRERDHKVKTEKGTREHQKKMEVPRGPAQQPSVPVPPLLRKQTSNMSVPPAAGIQTSASASPHLQIATPVIPPKAPSPGRPRQASQQGSLQGSHQSSPKSAQIPSGSSATSPSTTQQVPAAGQGPQSVKPPVPNQPHHAQLQNHAPPLAPPPGMPYPASHAHNMQMNGFPAQFVPTGHNVNSRYPPGHESPMYGTLGFSSGQYRGFSAPNGLPYPPGISNPRPIGSGPPGIPPINAISPHTSAGTFNASIQGPVGQKTQPHSRQPSGSMERVVSETAAAQPIAPPQHVKRESLAGLSGEQEGQDAIDGLEKQLGSSALLDDEDAPSEPPTTREAGIPPGSRVPFGSNTAPLFQEPFRPNRASFTTSPMPFSSPGLQSWTSGPSPWGHSHNGFGGFGGPATPRYHGNRSFMLRQLVVDSCRRLSHSPHLKNQQHGGFHGLEAIAREVNYAKPAEVPTIDPQEIKDICDTEGNAQNGGGTLQVRQDGGNIWIKLEDDIGRIEAAGGAIGSPAPGNATQLAGFGVPTTGQQHQYRGFPPAPGRVGGF